MPKARATLPSLSNRIGPSHSYCATAVATASGGSATFTAAMRARSFNGGEAWIRFTRAMTSEHSTHHVAQKRRTRGPSCTDVSVHSEPSRPVKVKVGAGSSGRKTGTMTAVADDSEAGDP